MYKKVPTTLNFVEREKETLKFWKDNQIFEKSVQLRQGAPAYTFFDGPPTANGKPHIGHVLTRAMKDIIPRYKTMRGYDVLRKAGWDTHGLPVELEVEKELGLDGKEQIEQYGVIPFIQKCKESVWKYKGEWEVMSDRMGFWADMDNPYITYDNDYIESEWWALKAIYEKGLLYKGHKIVPYCPRCGTALSSHEVAQGYKEVKETSATVRFRVPDEENTYFLAWTTTPWTLPSNVSLCVNPDVTYAYVRVDGKETLIMAKDLIGTVLEGHETEIVKEVLGKELEYKHYEPLFECTRKAAGGKDAFYVMVDDYVTTTDGTGIVHNAPAFGEDDYRVCKKYDLPFVQMVDSKGEMCGGTPWDGVFVKKADPMVLKDLDERGLLFAAPRFEHSYPFCWRCDTPLIYYARSSWFIAMTKVKDRLIDYNRRINWIPETIKEGRMGNFLENVIDWGISRERYWGTPLPIWRTEDGLEEIIISDFTQLSSEIDKAVEAGLMKENPITAKGFKPGVYTKENYELFDIHRPYVDEIILLSPSGKPMRRETDLIDVWFDSGAMPYAQCHYPFEHKEDLESGKIYPADFIAEGVDQTRGWFYTLHAIAGMVFNSVAYKAVISNGLVLDKNGNKMSKKLGNAIDPFNNIERFGSDAVRWYMIENSQPWDNIKYDEEGVAEVSRKLFATLQNTYKFLALYANVDDFDPNTPQVPLAERPEIDRWILSLLNTLVKDVTADLDDYEPTKAARAISAFVGDNLSNWYVRLNRKRFWGGTMNADKLAAYQTLYTCLKTVALLMAPFAPFYADRLYNDLTALGDEYNSVHLALFPTADEAAIDPALERRMALAQIITSNVLALRRKVNIKVRQPLAVLMIPAVDREQMDAIEAIKDLVAAEVNVKELRITPPGRSELVKRIKADFKKLGPRFGKIMKDLSKAINTMSQEDIARLENEGSFTFSNLQGEPVITLDDVEIIPEDVPGWIVANEGNVTVALDITLTPELKAEGMARELVNRIQNLRKAMGLEITDRINVILSRTPETEQALTSFRNYIATQVLADSLELSYTLADNATDLDIDGLIVKALVNKV